MKKSHSQVSKPRIPRGIRPIRLALAIVVVLFVNAGAASAATLTVDASKQTTGNPHFWSASFGTGKAMLTLRSDLQTHYKLANRELGAERVRGHGLLNSGEMDLWKAAGSYDWKNLDTYLTAITSAGMRPIMELDFMPTGLASSSSDAMHSPPKDYNEWKSFIKALVQHCVDKYGADDVGKWYWEVWNEPDYPGFWVNTDMPAYYTLYDNTVAALTSVLPNVLVGGPATTYAGPVSDFLKHCKSAGTRVTFVSSHNYPGGGADGKTADAANLVSDNSTRISAITGNGYTTSAVKSFNTEWNSSYSGQGGQVGDAVTSMDNHWNVGFILKAAKLLSDKDSGDTPPLDVFSYWAVSDVFDEDGGTDGIHMTSKSNGNTPFDTVFGLITFQGMRKAAWNAFKLLNYTGPKRLQSSGGTGSDGVDGMATISAAGDEIQILVYNYYKTLNTASGSGDSVTVNVSNLPSALAGKDVFVTQVVVDETHSNPYSVWVKQGKPASPTEAQWQEMRAAQHLALMQPVAKKTVDTSFSTTFSLSKQAGALILVSAKRSVVGRNAFVEIEGEDYDGQSGATKEGSGDTTLGQSISITAGGNVYFENVDYSDAGANSVQLRVKTAADVTMELHQDKADGTLLGKCPVTSTSNAWASKDCSLSNPVTGVSKLYLVSSGAAHLNWLKFQGSGTGGAGGSGGTTGTGAGGSTGGAGGAGGSRTGGAGGSPTGGAGGSRTGGAGGSPTGGAGGSPSGGAIGGAGGSRAGGSGGGPTGGTGGSPTGGAGGSPTGGSLGGAGGSPTGGAEGSTSSAPGNGGTTSASPGSGGDSGSGGSRSTAGGGKSSGCSCRVGDGGRPSEALLTVGFVALVLGLRKRNFRRCR